MPQDARETRHLGQTSVESMASNHPQWRESKWINLTRHLTYESKVRLGYSKSISVLYGHLKSIQNHPSGINLLSMMDWSNTEPFSKLFQTLVDVIGLETSLGILERASLQRGSIEMKLSEATSMDNGGDLINYNSINAPAGRVSNELLGESSHNTT